MFGEDNSKIPEEIAIKIFGFFSKRELCTASKVNKQWKRLCDSNLLWESLAMKDFPVAYWEVRQREKYKEKYKCQSNNLSWKKLYRSFGTRELKIELTEKQLDQLRTMLRYYTEIRKSLCGSSFGYSLTLFVSFPKYYSMPRECASDVFLYKQGEKWNYIIRNFNKETKIKGEVDNKIAGKITEYLSGKRPYHGYIKYSLKSEVIWHIKKLLKQDESFHKHAHISKAHLQCVCEDIKTILSKITHLNLPRSAGINWDYGISVIFGALENNLTIREINLSGYYREYKEETSSYGYEHTITMCDTMSFSDFKSICAYIRSDPPLKSINLLGNHIGSLGGGSVLNSYKFGEIELLEKALESNTTLVEIRKDFASKKIDKILERNKQIATDCQVAEPVDSTSLTL